MKFWDIIFYNKGAGPSDGNNYWKKYRVPHYIYVGVMLFLMAACVGLVSLFVCSAYKDKLGWEMFISYLKEPLILTLNLLPCLLLMAILYFATGRAWAAFLFTALPVFILSAVNYYKIRLRSEPFLVSDFVLVNEAAGIISNYTIEVTGRALIMVAALILGTVFCLVFMKGKLRAKWVRIAGAVVSVGLFAAALATLYISDDVYKKTENDSVEIDPWNELEVYVSKGFMYPFLNSAEEAVPRKPEDYNKAEAAALLAEYDDSAIPEDKKVNVIAVMLESYADLSEHEEVPVYDWVYEPLHELYGECVHGHIVANTFGGGTIDSERSFLTGYANVEECRVPTNSHVFWLRENGYQTEGLHPGFEWFYNRRNVQEYLGFEKYNFIEDYTYGERTDDWFFKWLSEMYEDRDTERPYFNFSISFQNHGAYDSQSTVETEYLDPAGLTAESYNILNNYLSGIADTTERISRYIDSFRNSQEPVVLVFYGDHMPWLGDGNSVYHELGINIDQGTEDGFYNYHSVPYMIWANDAAKEATGEDFSGEGADISPCYLMNVLAEECGWEGSAYMKLTGDIMERLPVINTGMGIFCADGEITRTPSGETADYLRRFELAEYYMKHNFIYDNVYGG